MKSFNYLYNKLFRKNGVIICTAKFRIYICVTLSIQTEPDLRSELKSSTDVGVQTNFVCYRRCVVALFK